MASLADARTCAELDQGGKVARSSRRWRLGDRLIVACSATRRRRANLPSTPLMASAAASSQSNASLKAPCATASSASTASTVPLAVTRWTPHAAALLG